MQYTRNNRRHWPYLFLVLYLISGAFFAPESQFQGPFMKYQGHFYPEPQLISYPGLSIYCICLCVFVCLVCQSHIHILLCISLADSVADFKMLPKSYLYSNDFYFRFYLLYISFFGFYVFIFVYTSIYFIFLLSVNLLSCNPSFFQSKFFILISSVCEALCIEKCSMNKALLTGTLPPLTDSWLVDGVFPPIDSVAATWTIPRCSVSPTTTLRWSSAAVPAAPTSPSRPHTAATTSASVRPTGLRMTVVTA